MPVSGRCFMHDWRDVRGMLVACRRCFCVGEHWYDMQGGAGITRLRGRRPSLDLREVYRHAF